MERNKITKEFNEFVYYVSSKKSNYIKQISW